ncbi:MAG: polysaccharide deacetylase family protein [Bacteroidota bacterium]|nr:polysaccharide deacetylase family protein [Bacteroidota bacterium]
MSIVSRIFPDIIWNIKEAEKKLYLTFDDGPTPEITEWVLNLLEQYNAKASFFCIGKNVEKYPELFKKIKEQEHSVGNHSYSHINAWISPNKKYFNDIERANILIESELFRPPYGKIKPSQIKHLKEKYQIYVWDVLSKDYKQSLLPKNCYKRVLNLTKAGSVIVFHDTVKAKTNLQYTLPLVLKYYSNKGFEFCSL